VPTLFYSHTVLSSLSSLSAQVQMRFLRQTDAKASNKFRNSVNGESMTGEAMLGQVLPDACANLQTNPSLVTPRPSKLSPHQSWQGPHQDEAEGPKAEAAWI
jgi:hypothetical protein